MVSALTASARKITMTFARRATRRLLSTLPPGNTHAPGNVRIVVATVSSLLFGGSRTVGGGGGATDIRSSSEATRSYTSSSDMNNLLTIQAKHDHAPSRLLVTQPEVDAVVLFSLLLAAALLVPCLYELCVHVWLIARGRTLYEWRQIRRGRRPNAKSLFDYGVLNNFALTLGIYPLAWVWPARQGIVGNGIFYAEQEHFR